MTCKPSPTLIELAGLFLKLGTTAFGGPAAHIAMMEEEVVRRRKWLTAEEFLDLIGATNLIPGPNSTELAIHIGQRRAGWPGLIVTGVCFILPAMLIVTAIAWAYVRYGQLPEASALLYGVKPVIIAVVLQALWNLGKSAVKTKLLAATGVIAAAASFFGVNELLVLFGCGFALLAICATSKNKPTTLSGFAPIFANLPAPSVTTTTTVAASVAIAAPFSLNLMFFFFESGRGPVRQRLRAAGLAARRAGRASGLAQRGPAD